MNKRFFEDSETNTITIYNEMSDGSFKRTVITNVYVRKVRKSIINSKGEEVAGNATIIIPVEYAEINGKKAFDGYIDSRSLNNKNAILNFTLNAPLMDNPWTVFDGSYIVDKEINLEFDEIEIKKEFTLYRVQSVADNRKGGLKHLKLEVSE